MLVFPNGFKTKTAIQLGKAAIHDALLLTLEMNRDELEQSNLFWHTTPKIERLPKETVYGFVSNSTLKFRFFSSMRIAPYLNDLGLLPLSAKGKPIVRLKQGKKSFVELVQEMRPDQQKRLLREILRDQDIFKTKLWTQNHCMDWREIEKLGSGSDFSKHFNTLFAKEAKKSTGKGDKVNLAVVWMAVYFLCHQKIRWVSNQSCLQTDSLLNAFAPFNGAVFFQLCLKGKHPFAFEIVALARTLKQRAHNKALRYLLLDGEFGSAQSIEQFDKALFKAKQFHTQNGKSAGHFASFANRLYKRAGEFFSAPPSSREYVEYFENNNTTRDAGAARVFGWLYKYSKRAAERFEAATGFARPAKFPSEIVYWSEQILEVLDGFKNLSIEQTIKGLEHWLFYLTKVHNEDPSRFPHTFSDIRRVEHISETSDCFTYMKYLRGLPHSNRTKEAYVKSLHKLFYLAIEAGKFDQEVNPVDKRFDKFKVVGNRGFGTHRDAIPNHLYEYIKTINRENNFAFARSIKHAKGGQRVYVRTVFDHHDQKTVEQEFLAVPVILDLILTSGARTKEATEIDSGEGDKLLVAASGAVSENTLVTANPERQAGALKWIEVDAHDQHGLLGLNFISSKTGPYSIPYIDPNTAVFLEHMRDWQIRFNPIQEPVTLTNRIDRIAGRAYLFEHVFPLFRDPKHHLTCAPPSYATIQEYWSKLLNHCQQRYISEKGNEERFVVSGKPIWNFIPLGSHV